MQTQQQKQLENLIEVILSSPQQGFSHHADQILKLVSHRVDMPKHLIGFLSKKLSIKQQHKISSIFDILHFVTEKFDNKIALFNQISGNKEFLFKITSILSLKDLNQKLKVKIVDILFEWKEMFKENKELFPNFWTFYQSFEKKGLTPSNLNFQTRYQQQNQQSKNTALIKRQNEKKESDKNIFDLLDDPQDQIDFNKIQKSALCLLYKVLQLIKLQNIIISNTSPEILDIPPVLRQNMANLKIMEEKINKQFLFYKRLISEHKNKVTINTTMTMVKAIHLTQKRYTELLTKYLPQKFELSEHLKKFQDFCKANQSILAQAESLKKQIDLLDINDNKPSTIMNQDLLDLSAPVSQSDKNQKGIKNFFGNLLEKVNSPPQQVTLSNKPIQDDFKTDMVLFVQDLGSHQLQRPKNTSIAFLLCEKSHYARFVQVLRILLNLFNEQTIQEKKINSL